jgi:ethanolamine utilization microcompartment shell protein EutL
VLGVTGSLASTAAAHPALLLETAILAAVAFALPYVIGKGVNGKGLLWCAGLGVGMLVATIVALPADAPFSLAAALAACSIAVAAFSALRVTSAG